MKGTFFLYLLATIRLFLYSEQEIKTKLYCRALGNLKKYVKNKSRPEGSIAEGYIINEALTYCSMYLHEIETRFNRPERNPDYVQDRSSSSVSVFRQLARPFGRKRAVFFDTKGTRQSTLVYSKQLSRCVTIDGVTPRLTRYVT